MRGEWSLSLLKKSVSGHRSTQALGLQGGGLTPAEASCSREGWVLWYEGSWERVLLCNTHSAAFYHRPPSPHTHTLPKTSQTLQPCCSSPTESGGGWVTQNNEQDLPRIQGGLSVSTGVSPGLPAGCSPTKSGKHHWVSVSTVSFTSRRLSAVLFRLITDSLLAPWNTNFLKDKSHSRDTIHINVFLLRSTSQLLETLKGINVLILRLWVSFSSAQKASSYIWANVTAPPWGLQCISTRSLP